MLDEHCDMNRNVAKMPGLPYIDTRKPLLQAVPWYRLCYNRYVTKDGEHPNDRGTLLETELFAKRLLEWFSECN